MAIAGSDRVAVDSYAVGILGQVQLAGGDACARIAQALSIHETQRDDRAVAQHRADRWASHDGPRDRDHVGPHGGWRQHVRNEPRGQAQGGGHGLVGRRRTRHTLHTGQRPGLTGQQPADGLRVQALLLGKFAQTGVVGRGLVAGDQRHLLAQGQLLELELGGAERPGCARQRDTRASSRGRGSGRTHGNCAQHQGAQGEALWAYGAGGNFLPPRVFGVHALGVSSCPLC